MTKLLSLLLLLGPIPGLAARPDVSDLDSDYTLIFFPAFAHQTADGKHWQLQIQGCVYEEDKRRLALATLREALQLDGFHLTKPEANLFAQRTRLFMVEHKPGKKIVIRIGKRTITSNPTQPNGRFSAEIIFSTNELETLRSGALEFQAVLPQKDKRVVKGTFALAPPSALFVITDIDDTIKVTGVHDYRKTIRTTFLEPYHPVPGMADLYRGWAEKFHAQFFYVSASPWQLFLPLSDFLRANGFPDGDFSLKDFRLKDRTRFSLFESPTRYKPQAIEPILKQFPEAHFVLVGDSGEKDPEIYGILARAHPKQISHIFIRDLASATASSERYQTAFKDLPESIWTIFHTPSELSQVPLEH